MLPLDLAYPPFPKVVHMPFDLVLQMVVGYTIVRIWTDRPGWLGALGAFVPDLDYPLAQWTPVSVFHRGFFHTPAFLFILVGIAALFGVETGRSRAFAVGFVVELVSDTVRGFRGIMYLYPFSTWRLLTPIPFSELYWGSALYVVCFCLLVWDARRAR